MKFAISFKKHYRIFGIVLMLFPISLFFTNCSGGFEIPGMEEVSELSSNGPLTAEDLVAGQKLYATNCAACHGPVGASTKKGRSFEIITQAVQSIKQMQSLQRLSQRELAQIAKALEIVTIPIVNVDGRSAFACDSSQVSKTPILKLTNREFKNSIISLLNDVSTSLANDTTLNSLISALPSDISKADRFSSKEQNFLLTSQLATGYFEVAFRAGALVAGSSGISAYPNTNSCLASATITQTCHQNFVRELASRAFRRTVPMSEANSIAAGLWDASLSKTDLIQLTFTSVTQMPDFLYKVYDRGPASARGNRVLSLTAEELASKISFFLVGKAPDATLKSLASTGQILDKTIQSQQIDRLLATADAQEMIRRLFRESYGYDRFDNFVYSSNFLNGLSTNNLISSMTQELDNFFVNTILTKQGSFKDLMTSQESVVPTTELANVYGLTSTGALTLPANRAGFINRAGFLAKKSGNYTSPVKRGLMVLENVLCEVVGDPPPNAPTSVSETQIQNQYQSTRERYAHLSEVQGSACILCHSRINSLGYTFEGFDSIGRARSVERIFETATGPAVATVAIDTATTVPDLRSSPTNISNSQHLASDLSTNDKAIMCFIKHVKAFESRTLASASDGCQMNAGLKTLYGTGGTQGSIKAAIKELILADDFKLWSY